MIEKRPPLRGNPKDALDVLARRLEVHDEQSEEVERALSDLQAFIDDMLAELPSWAEGSR